MDAKECAAAVSAGEGPAFEFKRAGSKNLGRELCAFANAAGGRILIGVEDGGRICGVDGHNRLKSDIQTIAHDAEPPIAVTVESVGDALCVTVAEQEGKPYSFGGEYFVRDGANSRKMSREEVRAAFQRSDLLPLDEAPCAKFSLEDDLEESIWLRFKERAGIPADMEPRTALRNLKLLTEDGQMTQAGTWLLARDIRDFHRRAHVTCVLFRGTGKVTIIDRKDFHSDIYAMIDATVDWVESKLNTAYIIREVRREERLELPKEAIREAIVNALAHRDYRDTANVQIHISLDRLEIISPGALPAGMTEAALGSESRPRNALLFALLYRMKAVEQVGSGIRSMRSLCREYGCEEPQFRIGNASVTVTFPRPDPQAGVRQKRGVRAAEGRDAAAGKFKPFSRVREFCQSLRGLLS